MTIYSKLQQNVSDFRNAQESYWTDLINKTIPFHSEMLIHYGVAGKTLRFRNDEETPVIVFGQIENERVVKTSPIMLERDADDLVLKFSVQVYLSKIGSEIIDTGLIFDCALGKKDNTYYVVVANKSIECTESNGKLNFTDVFDYMLQRLYQFTDKSKF